MFELDDHRLCKIAFQADWQKGLGWMHGISSQLRAHRLRGPTVRRSIDHASCARAVRDSVILKHMSAEPGNHLQETYFGFKTDFSFEPYIWQSKNCQNRRCIALFRLGCHWLQVHRGRIHRDPSHGGNTPYERRYCPSCRGCVEDEEHAIFHCPDYRHLRLQFEDLFEEQQSPNALRSFLVHSPSHRLALFLIACKAARAEGPQNDRDGFTHDPAWSNLTRNDGYPDLDLGAEMQLGDVDNYDSS